MIAPGRTIHGVSEPLPAGEHVLWQGAPGGWDLARRVFRIRLLMIYFSVLLASRAGWLLAGGGSLSDALVSVLWLLPLAVAAVGMLTFMASLMARTTIYAITNRRVVMRVGIALPMTFNIPFRAIDSAGLRTYANGAGDIPLALMDSDRIAYFLLWPHARPWRFSRTEPMLRAIPNAARVAVVLSRALAAFAGGSAREAPVATSAPVPEARTLAAAAR